MNRRALQIALTAAAGLSAGARAQLVKTWTDAAGDATLRRTDAGANGPVHPSGAMPDLVRVTLGGWLPLAPMGDPFQGSYVTPTSAHFLRVDVVFKGVVNPPGPLNIGQGQGYDPFRYGTNPVYGFLEFDIDHSIDTGGDLDPVARIKYLGNVARFGRRPRGALANRTAVSAWDYDTSISTLPQYERHGGEFTLGFCGCYTTTVVAEWPTANGIFEAGEAWIVRSRYFRRTGGFTCKTSVFGGSAPKEYDPEVYYRFLHSPATNETTISVVYPLDMVGAGQMLGLPSPPPINFSAGDAFSIEEALNDIIINASSATGQCAVLMQGWAGRQPQDFLDVTQWEVRGLVGTAYLAPEDSLYAWTDTGFDETPGDMNGDGVSNIADRQAILAGIASLDGTSFDEDGVVNGSVKIIGFGNNFHLLDADGDGFIRSLDVSALCPADFNGDGALTAGDFGAFQTAFQAGDMRADFNKDGVLSIADFGAFQAAFIAGCP